LQGVFVGSDLVEKSKDRQNFKGISLGSFQILQIQINSLSQSVVQADETGDFQTNPSELGRQICVNTFKSVMHFAGSILICNLFKSKKG
jgi:hypothetical protein